MQECACGVVVDAVVEHSGNHIDLFWPWVMEVFTVPDSPCSNGGDSGFGAVGALPERMDGDSGRDFDRFDVCGGLPYVARRVRAEGCNVTVGCHMCTNRARRQVIPEPAETVRCLSVDRAWPSRACGQPCPQRRGQPAWRGSSPARCVSAPPGPGPATSRVCGHARSR